MRALFDYEPEEDTLLPCKEIGLPFQYGDILQVSFIANFYQFGDNYRKKISIFSNVNLLFEYFLGILNRD